MSSDWLPCDCLVKLQCDEEINVVHGYETIGDAKEEPCLECALLIALQGDDLDKADICLDYSFFQAALIDVCIASRKAIFAHLSDVNAYVSTF
ncbi:hypothetical protein ACHAPD_012232 [Fusarium lateritium]